MVRAWRWWCISGALEYGEQVWEAHLRAFTWGCLSHSPPIPLNSHPWQRGSYSPNATVNREQRDERKHVWSPLSRGFCLLGRKTYSVMPFPLKDALIMMVEYRCAGHSQGRRHQPAREALLASGSFLKDDVWVLARLRGETSSPQMMRVKVSVLFPHHPSPRPKTDSTCSPGPAPLSRQKSDVKRIPENLLPPVPAPPVPPPPAPAPLVPTKVTRQLAVSLESCLLNTYSDWSHA